jgi:hypothetical protein
VPVINAPRVDALTAVVDRKLGVAHGAQVCIRCAECHTHFRLVAPVDVTNAPTRFAKQSAEPCEPCEAKQTISIGDSSGFAGYKHLTHIDFLIAIRNNRKEQTRGSCPSNLAAPLTLRCGGAL